MVAKGFLDVTFAVDIRHKKLAPDCASGLLHVRSLAINVGGVRIDQVGDRCDLWHHVHQQTEALGIQLA